MLLDACMCGDSLVLHQHHSDAFPSVCDWVYTDALMQWDNGMFMFLLCSGEGLQPEDTVCLCAGVGHKSALKLVNKTHPVFFLFVTIAAAHENVIKTEFL